MIFQQGKSMATQDFLAFWLVMALVTLPRLFAHVHCHSRRSTQALLGYALVGHTYRQTTSRDVERCTFLCESEHACYSVNYNKESKLCELNRHGTFWFPEALVRLDNSIYVASVVRDEDPCLSMPCYHGGTCVVDRAMMAFKRCQCLPDFTSRYCEGMCRPYN